jgi:hypothetical protein
LEFDILQIRIYEVAFHDTFWDPAKGHISDPTGQSLSAVRLSMLWKSLECCKSLVQTFLSYPDSDLPFVTAYTYSKLCYVFISLAKFVRFDLALINMDRSDAAAELFPRGQISFVKETNFQPMAGQVLEKFTSLATDFCSPDGNHDAMWNLSFMMMIIMSGYEKEVGDMEKALMTSTASTTSNADVDPSHASGGLFTVSSSHGKKDGSSDEQDLFGSDFPDSISDMQWDRVDSMAWDAILNDFSLTSHVSL